MARSKTDRQALFVEEYLKCWNASEAARRAGYSRRSAGSIGWENMKKPEIRAAIDARLAEAGMSADEVLARLADQARADMREFVRVDRKGNPTGFDLRPIKPLHLVKKISITDKGISVELHDSQAALEKLGEYHKLFVQQHQVSGSNGAPLAVTGDLAVITTMTGTDLDQLIANLEAAIRLGSPGQAQADQAGTAGLDTTE